MISYDFFFLLSFLLMERHLFSILVNMPWMLKLNTRWGNYIWRHLLKCGAFYLQLSRASDMLFIYLYIYSLYQLVICGFQISCLSQTEIKTSTLWALPYYHNARAEWANTVKAWWDCLRLFVTCLLLAAGWEMFLWANDEVCSWHGREVERFSVIFLADSPPSSLNTVFVHSDRTCRDLFVCLALVVSVVPLVGGAVRLDLK